MKKQKIQGLDDEDKEDDKKHGFGEDLK